MTKTVRPPSNLEPSQQPWARSIALDLDSATEGVGEAKQNAQAALTAAGGLMAGLASLSGPATIFEDSVSGGAMSAGNWYSGAVPTVTLRTTTGRVFVAYQGAVQNGSAALYPIITNWSDRASILGNYSYGIPLTGGASFPAGGGGVVVANVPTNIDITISLQAYASVGTPTLVDARIMAYAAP